MGPGRPVLLRGERDVSPQDFSGRREPHSREPQGPGRPDALAAQAAVGGEGAFGGRLPDGRLPLAGRRNPVGPGDGWLPERSRINNKHDQHGRQEQCGQHQARGLAAVRDQLPAEGRHDEAPGPVQGLRGLHPERGPLRPSPHHGAHPDRRRWRATAGPGRRLHPAEHGLPPEHGLRGLPRAAGAGDEGPPGPGGEPQAGDARGQGSGGADQGVHAARGQEGEKGAEDQGGGGLGSL
mmetsp:Transcript_1068/g.3270  ORF Transcript_1068/g.3270 Transcript_1068/m.3270 type:complete len:237 (-) Transcript_1068:533-1243(-)